MNGTEKRIAQDLQQADVSGYIDAIGIILSNGEEWEKQMKFIQTGQFKKAMESIENSIAEIEGYLTESPDAKDVLAFTLARAYGNKGLCIIMDAGQTTNNNMAKQGIRWIDKAFTTTNLPSESGNLLREIRAKVLNKIAQMEGQSSSTNSSNPSAERRTLSFNEVSLICPTCGKQSTAEIGGTCKGTSCTYNMDLFESGGGLACVKCGIGYHANPEGKGKGVLHCRARIQVSGGTSGNAYVSCRAPIPATPSCVTPKNPKVSEKKKDSCAPVAILLILLPISFMFVLWLK